MEPRSARTALLRSLSAAKLLCRRSSPCPFSTHIVGDKPILVRDYIRSALYDPHHGYFSKLSRPGKNFMKDTVFEKFEGRSAYLKYLDALCKGDDIAWSTPVELFKIYEIGGGSGSCAKYIMDYMMYAHPNVYDNMTYTSVEISPSLAKRQLETVGLFKSHLSRFSVECRDATDRKGWGDVELGPCWVIMLQVLENLPHDLVYSPNRGSPWMEIWLERMPSRFLFHIMVSSISDH